MKKNENVKTITILLTTCIVTALGLIGLIFTCHSISNNNQPEVVIKPNIPKFFEKDAREGLLDALKYYDIKDPEIVYCMAYLETGNFNSRLCIEDNNLLGLYNSKTKTFYKFDNWIECVKGYKDMVEYKRNEDEDMYTFLKRITYAEDSNYINKLKYLHEHLFN